MKQFVLIIITILTLSCATEKQYFQRSLTDSDKIYLNTNDSLIKSATGQPFVVSESKKCFTWDNKKIEKGDTLDMTRGFSIEKNGKLTIRHPNQWHSIYSIPSKYKLDTLFAKLKSTKGYLTHDSIFNILRAKNISHCDFPYKLICKPIIRGYATSYTDNIEQQNYIIETADPSIKIEWNYPVEYKGRYYVLVTNMFEEFIDMKVTTYRFIDLNLIPYKSQSAILYKVISEECRESDMNVIKMK